MVMYDIPNAKLAVRADRHLQHVSRRRRFVAALHPVDGLQTRGGGRACLGRDGCRGGHARVRRAIRARRPRQPTAGRPRRDYRRTSVPAVFYEDDDQVLRFLTAGESHGKGLIIDHRRDARRPAAVRGLHRRRPAPAPGRLRPRPAPEDRAGSRRDHRRRAPRPDARQPDRALRSRTATGRTGPSRWRSNPIDEATIERVTRLRPGHADLAGTVKYDFDDVRDVLERASARETAARVAVGAVCKRAARASSASSSAATRVQIGDVEALDAAGRSTGTPSRSRRCAAPTPRAPSGWSRRSTRRGTPATRSAASSRAACDGVPMGLGSHVHWDRKLDGLLAQALMSIHAVKGVEIGAGFGATRLDGSQVHDVILPLRAVGASARGRARRTTPAAPKAASRTARTSSCASR